MLLRLAYLGVTNTLALLHLLPMSNRAKDAEILALRHQITILERHLHGERVRFTWADRLARRPATPATPRRYPDRLGGTLIPIEARIVAVAGAYYAMTSERSYRAARTSSQAVNELNRCAGTQFDPQVVAAMAAEINENVSRPDQSHPAPLTTTPGT